MARIGKFFFFDGSDNLATVFYHHVRSNGGVVESIGCVDNTPSFLEQSSFLLSPSGYKEDTVFTQKPIGATGNLTFTRGSDAWRTNVQGLVERTPWNLLSWSEAFDNASWVKTNITISANTTTSPDGSTNADKIIATTTNDLHICESSTNSFVSGTTYTFSFYAKKSENDFIQFTASSSLLSTRANFNVSNGTLGTVDAGLTASITSVTDGWYRCIVTFTAGATGSYRIIVCAITTSTAVRFQTFAGNGTSGLFIWGAQLVEGTTAQTYLPTTDRLNFPRLSYMYGSCPSVLLEPQRTNLQIYSEQFDIAGTKVNSSVTANSTTSPDGNTTADTITENTASGRHMIAMSNITVIGTIYSATLYAKIGTRRYFTLLLKNVTGSSPRYSVTFDLQSGTSVATDSVGSPSNTSNSITNLGNGWYRLAITMQATGVSTNFEIGLSDSATPSYSESMPSYTGNGMGNAFIWGAQLEAGAYPTTYIPTTTATATRVADSFSRNNIFTNGLISASGGTWFVELRNNVAYIRDTGVVGLFIGDGNTGATNSITIRSAGSTRLSIAKTVGGTLTTLYSTTTDTVKVVFKWNGTSLDIFENGIKVVSASSFTTTIMEFLAHSTTGDVPKFIQSMALFPTPLSDVECVSLTTI